jgi:hypothetical protein
VLPLKLSPTSAHQSTRCHKSRVNLCCPEVGHEVLSDRLDCNGHCRPVPIVGTLESASHPSQTHSLAFCGRPNQEGLKHKTLKLSATIIQDLISSGKIVIRRGASLTGHVSGVARIHSGSGAAPRRSKVGIVMSSSSYGGTESGHPGNGGLSSDGQKMPRRRSLLPAGAV